MNKYDEYHSKLKAIDNEHDRKRLIKYDLDTFIEYIIAKDLSKEFIKEQIKSAE